MSRSFVSAMILALPLALAAAGTVSAAPVSSHKDAPIKEVDRGEIDKIRCDATKDIEARVGKTANFDVSVSSSDGAIKVTDVNYWFWADTDYNGEDGPVTFTQTKEAEEADGIVKDGSLTLVRSSDYAIRKAPAKRSKENMLIKYEIVYNEMPSGKTIGAQKHFFQCARIAVTSCGDGVVDKNFGEECDDGPNGSATCSKECKKIRK